MYQFTFILTRQDYVALCRHGMKLNSSVKKRLRALYFLIPFTFAVVFLPSVFQKKALPALMLEFAVYVVIAAVFLLCVRPSDRALLKRNVHLLEKNGQLPFGFQITLKFDEEGFSSITELTQYHAKYARIERVYLEGEAIYLNVNAVQAVVIPLRVFESDAQRDAFWGFINYKVAEAKAAAGPAAAGPN